MDTNLLLSKCLLSFLVVLGLKSVGVSSYEVNQTCVDEKRSHEVGNLRNFNNGDDVLLSGEILHSDYSTLSIRTIWRRGGDLLSKTLILDEERKVKEIQEETYMPTEIRMEGLLVKEEELQLHVEVSNVSASCTYKLKIPGPVAKTPKLTFSSDPQNERLMFIVEGRGETPRQIHILHFDSQHLHPVEIGDELDPCYAMWGPQGKGIVVIASPKGTSCGRSPELNNMLLHIHLDTKEQWILSSPGQHVDAVSFSSDENVMAYLAHNTTNEQGMAASMHVHQTLHLVNWTSHEHMHDIQMFEEKDIVFADENSINFLQLEEGLVAFVNTNRLHSKERVLDVQDNMVLTASRKEKYVTSLNLGHIHNNELTTTMLPETTTESETTTLEPATTTEEMTTTTTAKSTTPGGLPKICQDLLNSLIADEPEITTPEPVITTMKETTTEQMTTVQDTTTTEMIEIPKYSIMYTEIQEINHNMNVHAHEGFLHVNYKNMKHKNALVLVPDVRNLHYYEERTVALGGKLHHDLLIIDYDLSEGLEDTVTKIEDNVEKTLQNYDSIVFYGEGLGASIVSLITMQANSTSKVVLSDPELNLLSLISEDHTVLSWILGRPEPLIPSSEEIVYLWDMSPLGNVHNMTSEQLILISQPHEKEANVYYKHLSEHSPSAQIKYNVKDMYLTTGKWLIDQIDFSFVCRVEVESTTAQASTQTTTKRSTTKKPRNAGNKELSNLVQVLLVTAILIIMK